MNMKMPQGINVYRLKPFKILESGPAECFLYGFTYLKRSRTQIGFRNAHIDIFVCDAFSGSMRQFSIYYQCAEILSKACTVIIIRS